MNYAIIGARVILGLIFVVFGVNGFVAFLPVPEMNEQAGQFIGIMHGSGWLYFVKILEIAGGLMLLAGRLVPLGLVLLGPIIVNILLFHVFLDMQGLVMGLVLTALEAFLIWAHRKNFAGIFAL